MMFRKLTVAVAAAVLAFALSACGNSQNGMSGDEAIQAEQEAAAEAEQAQEERPYEGYAPRDFDELLMNMDAMISEAEMAKEEASEKESSSEELASQWADLFARANSEYREGNYFDARNSYQTILANDPLHYGANVNLTLALLQYGDEEEALKQALKCVYLFPDDKGCLLNAQVAATACGYGQSDIVEVLDETIIAAGGEGVFSLLNEDEEGFNEYYGSFTYNNIWNSIETDLYEAQQESDSRASEEYASIEESIQYQLEQYPEDSDSEQLLAYIEAVGESTGLAEGASEG